MGSENYGLSLIMVLSYLNREFKCINPAEFVSALLWQIKKVRPFGRTFCIGGGGGNYSSFVLTPLGSPSLCSGAVSR